MTSDGPVPERERAATLAPSRSPARIRASFALAGVLILSVLFFKNTWVDEDAYITFRSIEQFFAGNGLRWNPHERVQVFTHPLWLLLLSFFRLFTTDVFVVATAASYACLLAMAAATWRLLASPTRWAALLLLAISSKSFFDFTSSGLENPLAYALLPVFLLCCEVSRGRGRPPRPRDLVFATGILSLLLLTRHDLLPLVLPAFALLVWQQRGVGLARLATALSIGLAPFVLWTAFSLLYYGFPFPNTAYAKLATGIPGDTLWRQGLHYLASGLRDDPLALGTIGVAIALGLYERTARGLAVAAGLVLDLLYVVEVGGDYMTGRFLSAAFLVAALFVVGDAGASRDANSEPDDAASRRGARVLCAGLALYVFFLPGSPIRSGAGYASGPPNEFGVGDQRGIFFPITSIHRWWSQRERGEPFPDYRWTREGLAFASSDERVRVRANVGFMGYWSGLDRILIDRLGLTDPLLARLPSQPIWRIGHFPRRIPAGYTESVESSVSGIEDPRLRAYDDRLRILTRAPLWSSERFETILRMNLGHYDALLERTHEAGAEQ